MPEEKFPISETLKTIKGITLSKSDKWWSAVLLLESFGRKQIAVYLWNKRGDQWKRRQKFLVISKDQWMRTKETIEKLIPNLG